MIAFDVLVDRRWRGRDLQDPHQPKPKVSNPRDTHTVERHGLHGQLLSAAPKARKHALNRLKVHRTSAQANEDESFQLGMACSSIGPSFPRPIIGDKSNKQPSAKTL